MFARTVNEAWNGLSGLLKHFLQLSATHHVMIFEQRPRETFLISSASATYSMHVLDKLHRHIKIDYPANFSYVQTSPEHLRRNNEMAITFRAAESSEQFVLLVLAAPRVAATIAFHTRDIAFLSYEAHNFRD